jgi:glutathione synthase/RimK-type ligase-like ATP-grasp enzyme
MAVRTYLLYAVPELEKKMLNGTTYKNYPDFSKLLQMIILKRDGVPVPTTSFSNDYSTTQLPIVLKSLNGSNGQQVHYVQTPNDLETYATQYGSGNFLLQKPLPIGADYRVIVLGNRAIGMHKKVTTSGFLTNVTAGGRVEPVEEERREHIAAIALQAARSFACEYAGVDVMYDDKGEPRILEINRGAGFNKMQEDLWKIDLAENIISYVLSK